MPQCSFLAAAGEDDVLHAVPDQVGGRADAMRRRSRRRRRSNSSRRGCRTRWPASPTPSSTSCAAPCTGRRGARPFRAAGRRSRSATAPNRRRIRRSRRCAGRAPASSVQAGIGDRIAHRDVAVGGGVAHEALELAIDRARRDRCRGTPATWLRRPSSAYSGTSADAGAPVAQRLRRPSPRRCRGSETMPIPVTTTRAVHHAHSSPST